MRYTVIWEMTSYTTDEDGDENWVGDFLQEPFEVEAENPTEAIAIAIRMVKERTSANSRNVSPTFGRVREIIDENGVYYSEKGQAIKQLDQKTKETTKETPERIDDLFGKEGLRKFLVKIKHQCQRPGYRGESWAIVVSNKELQVGEKTKETIDTFCIKIPAGEIIRVEPYTFKKAQELGEIPKECMQCTRTLTEENIFGLTDVLGWGGRSYCSEKCFWLSQEV